MGNCIPSNIDLHTLVESPHEVRRSNYRTHDTWTTGEGDTSSLCSSSGIDENWRRNRELNRNLSKTPSSSRIFIRPGSSQETNGLSIISKPSSDLDFKHQSPKQKCDFLLHVKPKDGVDLTNPSKTPRGNGNSQFDFDPNQDFTKPKKATVPLKSIPKNNSFTARLRSSGKSAEDSSGFRELFRVCTSGKSIGLQKFQSKGEWVHSRQTL